MKLNRSESIEDLVDEVLAGYTQRMRDSYAPVDKSEYIKCLPDKLRGMRLVGLTDRSMRIFDEIPGGVSNLPPDNTRTYAFHTIIRAGDKHPYSGTLPRLPLIFLQDDSLNWKPHILTYAEKRGNHVSLAQVQYVNGFWEALYSNGTVSLRTIQKNKLYNNANIPIIRHFAVAESVEQCLGERVVEKSLEENLPLTLRRLFRDYPLPIDSCKSTLEERLSQLHGLS